MSLSFHDNFQSLARSLRHWAQILFCLFQGWGSRWCQLFRRFYTRGFRVSRSEFGNNVCVSHFAAMRFVVFVAVCPVSHLLFFFPARFLLVSARLPVSGIPLPVPMATGTPVPVLQVSVSVTLRAPPSPLSPVTTTKPLVISFVIAVTVAVTIVFYPISIRPPSKPFLVSVGRECLPVIPVLPPISVLLRSTRCPTSWHPPRSHKVTGRWEGGFHSVGGRHPKASWPWRGPSVHHVVGHVSWWHQGKPLQRRGWHSGRSLEWYQTRPGTQEASGWSLQPNNRGWWRGCNSLSAWNRQTQTHQVKSQAGGRGQKKQHFHHLKNKHSEIIL